MGMAPLTLGVDQARLAVLRTLTRLLGPFTVSPPNIKMLVLFTSVMVCCVTAEGTAPVTEGVVHAISPAVFSTCSVVGMSMSSLERSEHPPGSGLKINEIGIMVSEKEKKRREKKKSSKRAKLKILEIVIFSSVESKK
jgi:hypothetical protein